MCLSVYVFQHIDTSEGAAAWADHDWKITAPVLYYYTHKANPQPQVLAGNLLILASAICLNPPTSNHSLVPKNKV